MKKLWISMLCILLAVAVTFSFTACDPAAQKLELTKSITIKVGESKQLKANLQGVEWSSSDASVVTVDEKGNISGVKEGTATITATLGELSATCEVKVEAATSKPGEGGNGGEGGSPAEVTAAGLIHSIDVAKLGNIHAEATIERSDGDSMAAYVDIAIDEDGINGDIIAVSSETEMNEKQIAVMVLVIRNSVVYAGEIDDLESDENIRETVQAYFDENPTEFEKLISIDEALESVLGEIGMGSMDEVLEFLGSEEIAPVVELAQAVAETLADNIINIVFNSITETESGYTLAIDFNKHLEDLWNALHAVAELIDANAELTVSQLYASDEVKALLTPVMEGLTGKQLESVLTFIDGQTEGEISELFEIITAEDEDLYTYLGKYLGTIKVQGVTVGSLLVQDVVDMVIGAVMQEGEEDAFSLVELMDEAHDYLFGLWQNVVKGASFELRFNKEKQLTAIVCGAEVDVSEAQNPGSDVDYAHIVYTLSAKIEFSNTAPTLLDASTWQYTEVEEKVDIVEFEIASGALRLDTSDGEIFNAQLDENIFLVPYIHSWGIGFSLELSLDEEGYESLLYIYYSGEDEDYSFFNQEFVNSEILGDRLLHWYYGDDDEFFYDTTDHDSAELKCEAVVAEDGSISYNVEFTQYLLKINADGDLLDKQPAISFKLVLSKPVTVNYLVPQE